MKYKVLIVDDERELGKLHDVAHGAGLATIWGSWARYVYYGTQMYRWCRL